MNKLTVALCTYNRAGYLAEAIKGIINQTYHNFDIIVYDNASTDNTRQVIESFPDERIKYKYFDKNVGMVGNWLRAIKECTTEYLSIAHDDDIWESSLIARELEIFEKYEDMSLVSCRSQYVDDLGEPYVGRFNSPFTEDKLMEKNGYFEMAGDNNGAFFMSAPAAMFRTSHIKDMDYSFFDWTETVADTYWYLKINENGRLYLIGDALLKYRKHSGQYSRNHVKAVNEHMNHILPLLATHITQEKAAEVRRAYENEIKILEFSGEMTEEFEESCGGWFLPNQLFIDRDFFARVKFLNSISRGKPRRYAIWGAGSGGIKNKKAFDALLPNFELVGFIDKFKRGECEGMPIFPPSDFVFDKSVYIIISTSVGGFDVMEFLKGKGLCFKDDFMVGNISV